MDFNEYFYSIYNKFFQMLCSYKLFTLYLLNNYGIMKVPTKLLQLIDSMKAHGDIGKIEYQSGFSRYQISSVLDGEESSDPEVIKAVADFYEERKESFSDYLTETE